MTPYLRKILESARPVARWLPGTIKSPLSRWLKSLDKEATQTPLADVHSDYAARLAIETSIFAEQTEVHDLPPIFHYWSNKWLRPQLETFGFSNPDQFFALSLHAARDDAAARGCASRFASIGCGNCDTEVRVAELLIGRGVRDFVIDCVDINANMLARGRVLAAAAGVADHIATVQGDFNDWQSGHIYDAVMANQSLHHVMNLEGLFDAIGSALTLTGRLITSDMIGRNGHMHWPEAMRIVHEYWRELPAPYRWNVQLQRHEEMHENWDCSNEGFEGIRAQDILPLLLERFEFELFIGYGNIIDPFIDRSFGPNFDADAEWDRALIDRIHARDEAEMLAGRIKPTHMMATLRKRPYAGERRHRPGLSPQYCVRGVVDAPKAG